MRCVIFPLARFRFPTSLILILFSLFSGFFLPSIFSFLVSLFSFLFSHNSSKAV
jgi:hypothetical protein